MSYYRVVYSSHTSLRVLLLIMLYILKLLSKIVVKLIYNEFESRRERTKNVSVQKSNSNPVGLNLQTHMQSVPITTCYEFESRSWRGVLDTTLYVIVCQ